MSELSKIFEQIQSVKLPTDYLNEENKKNYSESIEITLPELKENSGFTNNNFILTIFSTHVIRLTTEENFLIGTFDGKKSCFVHINAENTKNSFLEFYESVSQNFAESNNFQSPLDSYKNFFKTQVFIIF
jgi:phosphatidylserine decarboxylase